MTSATRPTLHPTPRFPRLPLFTALALIAFAILAAAFGSITGIGRVGVESGEPRAIRDLIFVDQPGGIIEVKDARTNALIQSFGVGEGGFVRGAMRGLGQDRRLRNAGPEVPWRLILWEDGRLTLADTATATRVDLLAFGRDNARVFANFLDEGSGLK